jgi:hypothetical protein
MNTLLIDVETIDLVNKTVFDFSYLISDKDHNIIESKSFIVEEGFDNIDIAYYKKNKDKYLELLEQGIYTKIKAVELRTLFNSLVTRGDVGYIAGFNLKFDIGALSYTFKKYAESKQDIEYEKLNRFCKILDIGVICAVACSKSGDYLKYCKENNFMTDKGNPKTSAEAFYSYMTDNPLHIETHMGMFDCIEEFELIAHFMPQLNANDMDKVITHSYNKTAFFRLL